MDTLIQPQDLEAERQVLGACLIDREAAEKANEILLPGDFYLSGHGEIFEAVIQDLVTGITPDIISVTNRLRTKNRLEVIGGAVYIASLSGMVASTAFIEQHCKILEMKSFARKILSAADKVKSKAYKGDYESLSELRNFAESEMTNIDIKNNRGGLEHVSQGLAGVMMDIENRSRKKAITGIPTGYPLLTTWLAGYQRGDLIILAGRPSMGKTTFAIQECKDAAIKCGMKTAFFSLEMTRRLLIEKLLVNEGMISAQNLRVGKLSPEEWDRIAYAAAKLMQAGVYIDDTTNLSTMDIAQRCRRMKAKDGLDMVFIDYLGFIKPHKKGEKRYIEIGYISKELKNMAKELNIPVMLLCQLSRDCESRNDKRPMLSDLRESGDLEQDADVVMFLYRDEYYNKRSDKKGMAELILSKQRNGPTGTMEIGFNDAFTRFVGG